MIDVSNLKDALETLGFVAHGDIHEKVFPEIGCSLKVDFHAKKLIYPNEIKGRERNNGFDKKENFVVFECVCRLLSKGYRPEHIELEKEWHLGHDPKGGRADICVTDTSGNMLFIIECKTWGREYDKALNNTKSDGAQLFSYWQQEQSCKWLVLYASDLKGGCIVHKASTIDCSDDANIVLLSKKDKSIKLYRDANTASAKYEAWKETYGRQIHDDLIFSKDSVAYQIGVKPLRKKDLRDFTPDDKIVNKFEEILRHNNVSDKENAFNRLVALFICKLVDESIKDEDDEVEFQYKQGTDTYETLQDRLQRLHRDGMEKFMREEILYVPADYPEWLFLTYTGSKRKSAIEDLRNTIRILKFYSNNEFTFKDVHNEELFYQNGKILVEMVQLFEKYRIVYPSKHQFLGDLFEQLLNKGFKQNEGVSVNSPQHRGRGEIRNQQFINKSKRRSDIGAVNGNCTIRCKFFVQNSLANSNAEFFCIRQAQSVPLRGRHNSIQLCKQIGCLLPVGLNAHTGGIVFLVDFCTFVNNLLLDWNGRNRNQHLFIKRCRYTTMSTCSSHCILSSFTHRSLVEEKKEKLSENFACMASKSMELATTKSDTVRQSLRNCAFSIFHAWGYFRNNEIWMTSYLPSDMPFYPTDHCGVLRCKNSEVNPRYLAHILEVEGRKMGFSRSYRASIDRVHGIAFTVPDISIQNNAMSKVADYEMAIKELEGSLEKIASRRSEIIRKALAE